MVADVAPGSNVIRRAGGWGVGGIVVGGTAVGGNGVAVAGMAESAEPVAELVDQ